MSGGELVATQQLLVAAPTSGAKGISPGAPQWTFAAPSGRFAGCERRPPPLFFWKSVIPGNFKSSEFVSMHSKELRRPFFVSVHSKGVVSNGVGRVNGFGLEFFTVADTPRRSRRMAMLSRAAASGLRGFLPFVSTKLLGPNFSSSPRCCPPIISSVISDQDEFCELPAVPGGGSPNHEHGHSVAGPNSFPGIPAWAPPLSCRFGWRRQNSS